MIIKSAELIWVQLRLLSDFVTSQATYSNRPIVLLKITGDQGEQGWGECSALENPFYTSEYLKGAFDVLKNFLLPLVGNKNVNKENVELLLQQVRGNQIAKSAVIMAILDADLRSSGTSLREFLQVPNSKIKPAVSLGIQEDIFQLLQLIDLHVEQGYEYFKLKIRPGYDLGILEAIRNRFPKVGLGVDANGAYNIGDMDLLKTLDDFDLYAIEQPFPKESLFELKELSSGITTPVVLDESIDSFDSALAAIDMGLGSAISIKQAKVGGILEAKKIHDLSKAAGIPNTYGGMFESGLGRGVGLVIASSENFTLPSDLSASSRYFDLDVTELFELKDGFLIPPTGAGMGVEVQESALEKLGAIRYQVDF